MPSKRELIATIGLGYVGLPVAVAFADAFDGAIGFDISARRVAELRDGHDRTGEVSPQALRRSKLRFTTDAADLRDASVYIVTVPTPIDAESPSPVTPRAFSVRFASSAPVVTDGMRPCTLLKPCDMFRK